MDIEKYLKAIQGSLNSPSPAETIRRKVIHRVKKDYERSLDVDTFYLWKKGQTTDVSLRLNTYNKKYSTVVGDNQEFTGIIDTPIQAGDVIYNPTEDEYYIVINADQVDYIYIKGLLYKCNNTLRWQDDNGVVWEYPVHSINTTQYNSGVYQGKYEEHVTSQHKITITSDENTNALRIDKRFFFGKNTSVPEVFRLTQHDSTSLNYDNGLIAITVLRDTYNENIDDIKQRICNVKPFPSETSKLSLSFIEPAEVRIGAQKTVTANKPIAAWRVIESDYSKLIKLIPGEGKNATKCVVKIPVSSEALKLAEGNFTLEFVDEDGQTGTHSFIMTGGN